MPVTNAVRRKIGRHLFFIRIITFLPWGIPRAACRRALNDEVIVGLRGIFSRLFYNVITSLPKGILTLTALAQDDEVKVGLLVLF